MVSERSKQVPPKESPNTEGHAKPQFSGFCGGTFALHRCSSKRRASSCCLQESPVHSPGLFQTPRIINGPGLTTAPGTIQTF